MKAFHENSKLCFIVVGVWREKNRLIYYNGDLTNRVVSIDADSWSGEQLREVVTAGEQLLNVAFDPDMIDDLIKHSSDAVSLVQEGCYKVCERSGIVHTQTTSTVIGKGFDA